MCSCVCVCATCPNEAPPAVSRTDHHLFRDPTLNYLPRPLHHLHGVSGNGWFLETCFANSLFSKAYKATIKEDVSKSWMFLTYAFFMRGKILKKTRSHCCALRNRRRLCSHFSVAESHCLETKTGFTLSQNTSRT